MYLQIKNVFKKLSCFKPFLPWHVLQEPQLPPPQRSCTCQHVLILLTEDKNTKSYCCPDCTSCGSSTWSNISYSVSSTCCSCGQTVVMEFHRPASRKTAVLFQEKPHIHQLSSSCSALHCVNWLLFPSCLLQQAAKLSALSPSQELVLSLQTICPWWEMGQTVLLELLRGRN